MNGLQSALLGYGPRQDVYEPITDARSEPLNLRVQIEDSIIGFYREDTGDKLLIPDELVAALERETAALERETE